MVTSPRGPFLAGTGGMTGKDDCEEISGMGSFHFTFLVTFMAMLLTGKDLYSTIRPNLIRYEEHHLSLVTECASVIDLISAQSAEIEVSPCFVNGSVWLLPLAAEKRGFGVHPKPHSVMLLCESSEKSTKWPNWHIYFYAILLIADPIQIIERGECI